MLTIRFSAFSSLPHLPAVAPSPHPSTNPTDAPSPAPTLACAILSRNVAPHIAECVRTCLFADEVVAFDSASDDGSRELASAAGARVVDTPFINFSQARNFALQALGTEWVLFVDADERVTPELALEVRRAIEPEVRPGGRGNVHGWWIPRFNYIVGRVMRGGGWYPDYQLRLLRRNRAHYDESREVHELAIVEGATDRLKEHLIHYNYESWAQFRAKQHRYTAYEAASLRHEGVPAHPRHLITRPLQAFWRRFVTWEGYRDRADGPAPEPDHGALRATEILVDAARRQTVMTFKIPLAVASIAPATHAGCNLR